MTDHDQDEGFRQGRNDMTMLLQKYHGLGNDYFVLTPQELGTRELTAELIRQICDRHFGAGSDGILLGPLERGSEAFDRLAGEAGCPLPEACRWGVRILNPDGSEAEKSGNGLRIFAQFLHDTGRVAGEQFSLLTLGGVVTAQVLQPRQCLRVMVGKASFNSSQLPMTGPEREVVGEEFVAGGEKFCVTCVSVGNPHCVVTGREVSERTALDYGALLENDARFPRRVNVQFMRAVDEHTIEIEIWERGAGYTLASGTSSSAAAAAAVRLGLCVSPVTVKMPGGHLVLELDEQWNMTLTGPAVSICQVLWPDA